MYATFLRILIDVILSFTIFLINFCSLASLAATECNMLALFFTFCPSILNPSFRKFWNRRSLGWTNFLAGGLLSQDTPMIGLGVTTSKIFGNEHPKYAPSTSWHFFLGMYTYWHRGQNILTREVLIYSLIPIGKTCCLSHKTLGQIPNVPFKYFSLIIPNPLGVNIKRAWISPYRSVASW